MPASPADLQTILFLAANPKDTGRLRVDQELRDIDEGLKRAQKRDQFKLEQRLAVRPRDIQRAMLDVNPQIIHFSGHGKGEAGLIFEDDIGNTQLVDGAALAGLFKLFADQIHCVVLNGCYSEVQAKAIAQHIPFVIGMNQGIGDRAAIAFAVGFYDALGAGRPIEFAYKLGCSAIRLDGIAEHLTPVLLKQSPEGAAMIQPKPNDLTSSASVVQPANAPIEVFISFSHKDDDLREGLVTHLSNLGRQGKITAWDDRAIKAGKEWEPQIKSKLESAQIILLLVSSDFIASDYCHDIEMLRAIERHNAGTACVIPILLRPCDWKGLPFSKLKILPKDGKAVTQWSDRDTAFVDVVVEIRRAVDSLTRNESLAASPSASERSLESSTDAVRPLSSAQRLKLQYLQSKRILAASKKWTFRSAIASAI
ncbi:MAG: TIR domain-containing protein [Oscillatoriophycideae cyanobacterium NC_groundwater_1537_Pr4_S-0.65um_50_18]|nr:TIR domain-containing protein [Oscillatoriophycideae cyanobacterium NC_groundwater_1537_Pr4_S-0.65um_50_18]